MKFRHSHVLFCGPAIQPAWIISMHRTLDTTRLMYTASLRVYVVNAFIVVDPPPAWNHTQVEEDKPEVSYPNPDEMTPFVKVILP